MLMIGTRENAQQHRKAGQLFNGTRYFRNDFFVSPEGDVCSPQCYLVEQSADSINPTHFHIQNQFQLFTRGAGTIGRSPKDLGPFIVHYAGAYTGYGPIVAGSDGVDYITMRAFRDPGAKFVPQQRAVLKPGPKRHWASPPLSALDETVLSQLKEPALVAVHGPDSDGLAIEQLRIPARSSVAVRLAPSAAGMFIIVLGGAIEEQGHRLQYLENLFVSHRSAPHSLCTGDSPAEVLILHMPAQDPAYA
ncbi:MAG: hypothetical protein ACKODB_00385 [Betaproteobacteria bacterium]|jgi:hypothetical protein